MRKLIAFTFVLLTITLLCSCSSLPDHLVKTDGAYYLILDKIYSDNSTDSNGSQLAPEVTFDSIAEMVNDFRTADFTEIELYELSRFEQNENGEIKICNLDHLYAPVYPEEYSSYRVQLTGERYHFSLYSEDGFNQMYIKVLSQYSYDAFIDQITGYDQDPDKTCTATEDRNAKIYTYIGDYYNGPDENLKDIERKEIVYTYERDGCTFYVKETYKLSTDTIPLHVDVYGRSYGEFIHLDIDYCSTRPSIEWLSQFGLKEYVETELS